MMIMTVVMKVRPEKQKEFLQAMRSLTHDPEKQEGLRRSSLYREYADDQTGFSLKYEWETQEDLERYLRTERFGVLLGALKVLCEKSEIWCSDTLWDGGSIPIPKESKCLPSWTKGQALQTGHSLDD